MATIDNYTIDIKVTGAQDLQVAVNSVDVLSTKAKEASSSVDSFNESLKKIKQSSSESAASLESLTKSVETLAAAIVGVGLAEFAKKAIEVSAQTSQLAQGLGISTQQFLEMSTAAGVAGISQESLARGLSRLATNIDAAQTGTGKQAILFEKLGLSAKELATLPLPDAFDKVTKAIAETSDTTLKAEASVQLLNRSFVGKVTEYADQHEKLAGTMKDASVAADDAKNAVVGLEEGMAQLYNNVTVLLDPLLRLIGDSGSGFLGAKITAQALLAVLGVATWLTVVKVFEAIRAAVTGLLARFLEATGGAELLAARAANASAQVAILTAREMELAAAVNVATASLAREMAAMEAAKTLTADAAANDLILALASEKVSLANEAKAATTEAYGAAVAATNAKVAEANAAIAAQTGIFAGLLASIKAIIIAIGEFLIVIGTIGGLLALPAWAAIGVAIVTITAVVSAGIVAWKAWGNTIKEIVGSVANWVSDKFAAIGRGLDWLAEKLAIFTNSTSYLQDIVVTAKYRPVPGGSEPPAPAQMEPNAQDKVKLDLLRLESAELLKRLDLEKQLINAGSTERANALALFDIEKQRTLEIARYEAQIKVIEADKNKTKALQDAEIALIKQEEGIANKTAESHKQKLKAIQEAQNAQSMTLYMTSEELKIDEKIKEARAQTAALKDTTSTSADIAVIAIDKLRDAAIDALKEKEKLFGPSAAARTNAEIAELTKKYEELKQATIDAANAKSVKVITDTTTKNELDTAKQIRDIKLQTSELSMTTDQKELDNLDKIYNERVKILDQEMNQNFGSDWKNKAPPDAMEAYANAVKAARTEVDNLKTAQNGFIAQAKDFSTAWSTSWKQYVEDVNNGAKQAQTMFSSVMNNMNTAIDNFVKTGKFSFKGFVQSVMQDFLAMELKSIFANLFVGLFPSLTVGLGTGAAALVGSAVALNTSVAGLMAASVALDASAAALTVAGASAGAGSGSSLLFFAAGGEPPVGRPSVVGENGPELFIPKVPGVVVPNDKITSGMGNAPGAAQTVVNHNYTYNINAIDSRSVAQVFAENRKSLLGAMTMAQKEMPYSMAGA